MANNVVLLVNLGTPDSASVGDVRRYLGEFLGDGRVVDLPLLPRKLLVNGVIVPFRSARSAAEYQKVWTETGSPLLTHSEKLATALQQQLGDDYDVVLAMRYQNPSLSAVLASLQQRRVSRLLVVPLFPQYASATSGSVFEAVFQSVSQWRRIPQISTLHQFADDPRYIAALKQSLQPHLDAAEHILFSYHGLPERQLQKEDSQCLSEGCCERAKATNELCYRAQCYRTSQALMAQVGWSSDHYSVAFQSRVGRLPWLQPYTEDVISKLAQQGVKRLLVIAPSFVSDCLETIVEIGEDYAEQFVEQGGESFELVPCLNSDPTWVTALASMVSDLAQPAPV